MKKRIPLSKSELVYKVPLSNKVVDNSIELSTEYIRHLEDEKEKYKLIKDRKNERFIKNGKERERFIRDHTLEELKEIVTDLSHRERDRQSSIYPVDDIWDKAAARGYFTSKEREMLD